MKKIIGIRSAPAQHWVGDGFPVRSLFSYHSHGDQISPFLLLDHAGPRHFEPAEQPRGVGEHPHRGFETVTIVYSGEVEHRDSTGAGGRIGPGDVQWMTAGAGIVHDEFHSKAFTAAGGTMEMVQLWVNLPRDQKMISPGYQSLSGADIPAVRLPDNAGMVRLIAGTLNGYTGPARTHTPMNVWDAKLEQGGIAKLNLGQGWNAMLAVLHGSIVVNDQETIQEGQLVVLGQDSSDVVLEASDGASVLVLSGEPIDEPVVGYGPFVMNSKEDIRRALADFSSGRFGRIPAETH